MLSFENDYSEGAHPQVLQALIDSNLVQTSGYGSDSYCESAKAKIRAACQAPDAEVFLLTGGTQTNAMVISAMLADYEGVVATVEGHVATHEAGAIEYTGHKVLTLPEHQGKMDAAELDAYVTAFYQGSSYDHMVFPGMVYISHPTEFGTLYTRAELEALSAVCRKHRLPLYLDGARLGYGLMSEDTDLTLPLIAELCDAFYIGGTKVGALCGEAVVFTRGCAPKHFLTMTKQHGAMLAKGRLLGVQFDALFTDGLYFTISRHAIDMAMRLKRGLEARGCRFFLDSPSNQQFIILHNDDLARLREQVAVTLWGPYDATHTIVRLVTSWATQPEAVDFVLGLL